MMDLLVQRAQIHKPDAILGLESRGFLFGPHIALQLQVPFVPIRKKGKLPGKVRKVSYQLEYGEVCLTVFCLNAFSMSSKICRIFLRYKKTPFPKVKRF
jgi:adenine phosphoribosyltransferase